MRVEINPASELSRPTLLSPEEKKSARLLRRELGFGGRGKKWTHRNILLINQT